MGGDTCLQSCSPATNWLVHRASRLFPWPSGLASENGSHLADLLSHS